MRCELSRENWLRGLPVKRRMLLRELGVLADEQGVSIYLVGGVVRDLLLRRENWDLDVTVEGDGIAFARLVADRYGAGIALFERFATARLVLPGGLRLDIASTRRESYAEPAALPDVAPASLKEDLYRRDFTINAMAIQLNPAYFGRLYDPYGGRSDLKAGTIRVLHAGSFTDDPTRIFRAIRFAERLGLHLEPATSRLLRRAAAANVVESLSGPRFCNEIFLLMNERDPPRAIERLVRLRLLRFLHPRLRYGRRTKRLVAALPRALAWWKKHCPDNAIDQPLLYVMALLSASGQAVVRSVIQRLQLSKIQSRAVEWAGKRTDRVVQSMARKKSRLPSETYRLLKGMPNEALLLGVALTMGEQQGRAIFAVKQRIVRFLTSYRETVPWITGRDLIKLGVKQGPHYGTLLDRLYDAQLNEEIRDKREARRFLRQLLERTGGVTSSE